MDEKILPFKFDEDQLRNLLDSLTDGVYIVNRDRRILFWSKGAERISGYTAREIVNRNCFDDILRHIDQQGCGLCGGSCPLAQCMTQGEQVRDEIYLHHKLGHRIPVTVKVIPRRDKDGNVDGAIEIFHDQSSLTSAQEKINQLEEMAFLDPVTGLATRRYVEVFLRSRHSELKRYNWPYGIIFMDIDDFKQVNDRHGHDTGDRMLKMIGMTLMHNARHFDLVGRWGGEEFLAVLINVNRHLLISIAEKFRVLVEKSSLTSNPHPLSVTLSCGAAMARPEESIESLLKRADELMYQAKSLGKNRVIF